VHRDEHVLAGDGDVVVEPTRARSRTRPDLRSTRRSRPPALSLTHNAPAPAAKWCGSPPTCMRARTRLDTESTTVRLPEFQLLNQTLR